MWKLEKLKKNVSINFNHKRCTESGLMKFNYKRNLASRIVFVFFPSLVVLVLRHNHLVGPGLEGHKSPHTRESLDGAIPDDPMQTTFAKDGSYLAVHNVLDSDTTADIMTKVVEWVINTKQSFSSIEAPSFKAMTKALNRF